MNKPRSDAKLLNLPQHQQDRISEWLMEGVDGDSSYAKVKEQVHLDFNVDTSTGALVEFYRQVVAPRRLRRAAAAADAVGDEADRIGVNFDRGTLAALKQKAFEILAQPYTDPKELVAFMGLTLDAQKIELKREDLGLQRDRFQFSASKAALKHVRELKQIAGDKSLNEEAKVEAVRLRLFGKAPEVGK